LEDFGTLEYTKVVTHKHGLGGKCGIAVGTHVVYSDSRYLSGSLKILLI
jgi:hypothetical protein